MKNTTTQHNKTTHSNSSYYLNAKVINKLLFGLVSLVFILALPSQLQAVCNTDIDMGNNSIVNIQTGTGANSAVALRDLGRPLAKFRCAHPELENPLYINGVCYANLIDPRGTPAGNPPAGNLQTCTHPTTGATHHLWHPGVADTSLTSVPDCPSGWTHGTIAQVEANRVAFVAEYGLMRFRERCIEDDEIYYYIPTVFLYIWNNVIWDDHPSHEKMGALVMCTKTL